MKWELSFELFFFFGGPWFLENQFPFLLNPVSVVLSLPPMFDPTPLSSSTKLEEILVALTTQQLSLSHKIDNLIQHLAHPTPSISSSLPRVYQSNPI